MSHLTTSEHAHRVMSREADRRGLTLQPDAEQPAELPAELAPWAASVAGKGWCVFAAVDPADEVTLPSEREFAPLPVVLAGQWQVMGGTGSVRVTTTAP